jgi:hypothetical protein
MNARQQDWFYNTGAFQIFAPRSGCGPGEDTDHGSLPWLVSPPASENLKYTLIILRIEGCAKKA